MPYWLQLTLSFTGVVGLILFMYWLMRKVNKQMRTASGSRLRILDRANTGRDSSLLVISVSGKLMLVGVSTGRVEKLCDLELSEEEYFGFESESDKPPVSFSEVLSGLLPFGAKKQNERGSRDKQDGKETQSEGEENTFEPDI